METILFISFSLIATLDSDYAGDEDARNIIAWILLALLGGLVVSFAMYVIVAGIVDLFLALIKSIKR